MRKTKIICTLGPSSEDENTIRRMVEAGMDVARLNFSHGDHKTQLERIRKIKKISKDTGKHISCLLDTKAIRLPLRRARWKATRPAFQKRLRTCRRTLPRERSS